MRQSLSSLLILLFLISLFTSPPATVKAQYKTIVVPNDYGSIQEAIEQASAGDMISVKAGTYQGGIVLDKPISLVGEGMDTTIIKGGIVMKGIANTPNENNPNLSLTTGKSEPKFLLTNYIPPKTTVMYVNSSDVTISKLKITGGDNGLVVRGDRTQISSINSGMNLVGSHEVVTDCLGAIAVFGDSSMILRNNVSAITVGGLSSNVSSNLVRGRFNLQDANYNTIANNTVSGSNEGLILGFDGKTSSHNIIVGNVVEFSGIWGILVANGNYNLFYGNLITNTGIGLNYSGFGVTLGNAISNTAAVGNLFVYNAFVNNVKNVGKNWPEYGNNLWDSGTEGNYWDDYMKRYPNALEIGSSGIGNLPYIIDADNVDHYPLLTQSPVSYNVPSSLMQVWESIAISSNASPSNSPLPTPNPTTLPDSNDTSAMPTINEGPTMPNQFLQFPPLITWLIIVTMIAVAVLAAVYFKRHKLKLANSVEKL